MNYKLLYSKRPGFSLIEIMIYIAIIAALLLGVMQLARTLTDRAKISKTRTILMATKNAVDQFKIDIGRYPTKIEELAVHPSDANEKRRWLGPYVPQDYIVNGSIKDDYGHDVQYKFDTAKNSFEVFSWGKEENSDVGNIFID